MSGADDLKASTKKSAVETPFGHSANEDGNTRVSRYPSRFQLSERDDGDITRGHPATTSTESAFSTPAEGVAPDAAIGTLAVNRDAALTPDMDIVAVMKRLDASGADELAVLDPDRHLLGIVSESFVRRRYAEELAKAQHELFGERD